MKTKGQIMAEKARKACNKLTQKERQELLARAMVLIYSK